MRIDQQLIKYIANTKGALLPMLLGIVFCLEASSAVRLPDLIADRMVLQRDVELKIWGWADTGEKVTVRFRGAYYYTEGGVDGMWSVNLPAQKAGGPYLMEINHIVLRDILIGDVWLCSGQSNMETPIERLVERFPEINVSNNHMIRYFKVPTQNAVESVKDDLVKGGRWYSGIASEVMNWTALAYFYAEESYRHTGVPVGMLVSSLGGSAIESWISQEHLKEFPNLLLDRVALDSLRIAERDHGLVGWTNGDWDDSDWSTFQVPGKWWSQDIRTRGVVYHRKSFDIPASKVGRHGKVYLGTLVDSDSVFINGHFVGSTAYMYPPRKYDVPAGVLRSGRNTITVRLRANSGNGEFVEDKPYRLVVDDLEIDLRGEWRYQVGLDLDRSKLYAERLKNIRQVGSGLYNGMIYPVRDYRFSGVIWYQGESNTGMPRIYHDYLKSLITNWRETLDHPNTPFLIVQLPNFLAKRDQPSESGWAGVREAQSKVAQDVPYTALAVTYDVGEWNDIHPLNKKDIAKRLFLGARTLVYKEDIVFSGPVYQTYQVEGDKVILTFKHAGKGLVSKDGQVLRHFAIAGEDKKYYWADAIIKGNKVVVSSTDVKQPVAVRYAWSDNPEEANLINKDGLLAVPFRTDNW